MEPNGLQARIRFSILSALETTPVFRMCGEEAVAAIPHFHYIDSMPETSGTELAWAILHSIDQMAIAFKADGVYCLFSNVLTPEMHLAKTEEDLRDFIARLPLSEANIKQAFTASLDAMRRRLDAAGQRVRVMPPERAMPAAVAGL